MKKTFRFYATMLFIKVLIKFMQLVGKKATNLPGEIALKLCPNIIGQIDKPETIIAVTGTNGKTTVCNMIEDALHANGYEFMNNRFGGNVDTGIATTLIKDSTLTGKATKKLAVLEVDERSANRIYPHIKPNYIVCTNLSRDSFKRNAHTEFIAGILNKYIPDTTKLILNGDDLISNHLKWNNERTYFGVAWREGEESIKDNIIKDIVVCPKCDSPLNYDFVRYNHIGRAHCSNPNCDYGSPEKINFEVKDADYKNRIVTINHNGTDEKYRLVGDNITDLYNMTAAITLLRTFGLTSEQVNKSFNNMKIVETRFNAEEINGKKIIVNLAKGQNPIACSRACDFVRRADGNKAVIMIPDDMYDARRSTENIAWIYDTDYEFLNQENIKQVIVGGKRSSDYHVRLLMAGIPEEKIKYCTDETETAKLLDLNGVDKVFILYDIFNVEPLKNIKEQVKQKMLDEGGNK